MQHVFEAGLEETQIFYQKIQPIGFFFNKTRILFGLLGFVGLFGLLEKNLYGYSKIVFMR